MRTVGREQATADVSPQDGEHLEDEEVGRSERELVVEERLDVPGRLRRTAERPGLPSIG